MMKKIEVDSQLKWFYLFSISGYKQIDDERIRAIICDVYSYAQ